MLQVHDKFWAIDGDYSIELNEVFVHPKPLQSHYIPVIFNNTLGCGSYTDTWLSYKWDHQPMNYINPNNKRPLLFEDTELVFAAKPKLILRDGKKFAAPGFSVLNSIVCKSSGRHINFSCKVENLDVAYDLLKSKTIDGLYYVNKEVIADFHHRPSINTLEALNAEFDHELLTALQKWATLAPEHKNIFSSSASLDIINDAIDKYSTGWRATNEIVRNLELPAPLFKFLQHQTFGSLAMSPPTTRSEVFNHDDFLKSLEPWIREMLHHAIGNSPMTAKLLSEKF